MLGLALYVLNDEVAHHVLDGVKELGWRNEVGRDARRPPAEDQEFPIRGQDARWSGRI